MALPIIVAAALGRFVITQAGKQALRVLGKKGLEKTFLKGGEQLARREMKKKLGQTRVSTTKGDKFTQSANKARTTNPSNQARSTQTATPKSKVRDALNKLKRKKKPNVDAPSPVKSGVPNKKGNAFTRHVGRNPKKYIGGATVLGVGGYKLGDEVGRLFEGETDKYYRPIKKDPDTDLPYQNDLTSNQSRVKGWLKSVKNGYKGTLQEYEAEINYKNKKSTYGKRSERYTNFRKNMRWTNVPGKGTNIRHFMLDKQEKDLGYYQGEYTGITGERRSKFDIDHRVPVNQIMRENEWIYGLPKEDQLEIYNNLENLAISWGYHNRREKGSLSWQDYANQMINDPDFKKKFIDKSKRFNRYLEEKRIHGNQIEPLSY